MTEQSGTPEPELVGSWRKVNAPECAQKYPEELTFSTGTYRGARGAEQGFISWDAGIYRLENPGRLVVGTATDELVAYQMHVEGDVLQIVDPDGCRFSYQRVRAP
jgi:hypothetical protein